MAHTVFKNLRIENYARVMCRRTYITFRDFNVYISSDLSDLIFLTLVGNQDVKMDELIKQRKSCNLSETTVFQMKRPA